MSHLRSLARGMLAVGLVAGASACTDNAAKVVGPRVSPYGDIFNHYVSIGNSIAAGVQSNGINDSTQKQSFAYLFAQQLGTRFAVPFLPRPGCTPPIANWQTGALVQTGVPAGSPPANAATCTLRDPAFVTSVLNNVAVPSAASTEVNNPNSQFSN